MKKLKVIQGIWFGLVFLATMTLVGKFINQILAGHAMHMLMLALLLLSPLGGLVLYTALRMLDDRPVAGTLLWLAVASVYVASMLHMDAPRQAVADMENARKVRDDFDKAPPRRFVDKEAQVVCYESREFDGGHPALYCLPLSQTALKLGAQ